MKILLVFPGKVWGGAEQVVLDMGEALSMAGHTVRYVARDKKAIREKLDGMPSITFFKHTSLWHPQSICPLTSLLKVFQPDIVHIHDFNYVGVAVLSKMISKSSAKIFVTYHDAHRTPIWWPRRFFFRYLHHVVFVSQYSFNRWRMGNQWLPAQRCAVIHNGIPDGKPSVGSDVLRNKYNISCNTLLLVFAGRVRKSKGCATIIEAMDLLKDLPVEIVFIGRCKPDNYQQKLKTMARQLGVEARIHFHGFSNDVRQLIQGADIGVLPSIMHEACPLTPMEFMQQGIPVVTTNDGGQTEFVVDGENGLLVPAADAHALAEALRRLATDVALRHKLGQAARQTFQESLRHSLFLEKIVKLYKE